MIDPELILIAHPDYGYGRQKGLTDEEIEKGADETLDALLQAYEKQVPMKPAGLEWDSMSMMRFGRCKCGRPVHEPYDEDVKLQYCHNCGKAIDWS